MRRKVKIIAILLTISILICLLISIYVGLKLTTAKKILFTETPAQVKLVYEDITFQSIQDGLKGIIS